MARIARFFVPLLSLLLVAACAREEAPPPSPAPTDPFDAAQSYVEDFVRRETGDEALAGQLGADGRKAWQAVLQGLRDGRSARDSAAALTEQGLNVVVLPAGTRRFELPGKTVSVLLMDAEDGCRQIVRERWVSAEPEGPARLALIGIGRQDVDAKPAVEKKIHLMAFELPVAGDYLDTNTNSLSPFGKIVIGFGAVIALTGCNDEEEPTAVPLSAEFTVDPNVVATPDRQPGLNKPIVDGAWDASTMQIAFAEEAPRIWTSFTRTVSVTGSPDTQPVPGNTVQVWLTDTDRVKIIGIKPTGMIDDNGRRAVARTDAEGRIHVQLERRGVTGAMTTTLWGHDPAHDAIKKVEITLPET